MLNKIILASASPRRKEILQKLCSDLVIIPTNIEEVTSEIFPQNIVMDLAAKKIKILTINYPNVVVVGADTIVWYDGKPMNKPCDIEEAFFMLSQLNGKTHQVYTGVAVSYLGKMIKTYEKSDVTFKKLSDEELNYYINKYNPFDKAGAYGIQDGYLVESFNGNEDNIIGFPQKAFLAVLEELSEQNEHSY